MSRRKEQRLTWVLVVYDTHIHNDRYAAAYAHTILYVPRIMRDYAKKADDIPLEVRESGRICSLAACMPRRDDLAKHYARQKEVEKAQKVWKNFRESC